MNQILNRNKKAIFLSHYNEWCAKDEEHRLIKSNKTASSWQRKEEDTPQKTVFADADYADDIGIQANTPIQVETLLHTLERAAAGIGLHVNEHKMEYMCFNQTGDISTLDGSSLKLVDKFTYLGSSVSSTEKTSTRS